MSAAFNSTASSTAGPTDSTTSLPVDTSSVITSSESTPITTETPTSSTSSSTSVSTPSTPTETPTSTPTPTPTPTPTSTSTVIIPTTPPPEVILSTSVVTFTPTDGATPSVRTILVTPTSTPSAPTTTTTTPAVLSGSNGGGGNGNSKGLSTAGTTAVAVVVPVVVVALLVVAGIFFWRRRKQKKNDEELRRKEVEEYGFNPNNDPTLPAVASENGLEMSEDHSSGYRGWGAAGVSNRKMSTTLSGGHTQGQLSDAGSNPYRAAGSPNGGYSDGHSGDAMLDTRRETMTSDDIGELGRAPVAGGMLAQPGMKRGPSNASSTYSAAAVSDVSDGPGNPGSGFDAYQPHNGYGYSQHGPYGEGNEQGAGMPIVRDVSARRNTRIQQPGNYQQGNSGISQNF